MQVHGERGRLLEPWGPKSTVLERFDNRDGISQDCHTIEIDANEAGDGKELGNIIVCTPGHQSPDSKSKEEVEKERFL